MVTDSNLYAGHDLQAMISYGIFVLNEIHWKRIYKFSEKEQNGKEKQNYNIYIYILYSISKEIFLIKEKCFPRIFSINVNSAFFYIGLQQTLIIHAKVFLAATQNLSKSNRVFQAWPEVCHQIFGGWKVQPHETCVRACDVFEKACLSSKISKIG